MVLADPDKIDQVLVNFVNNAIKYAPSSKTIHIHIEKLSDSARITVTDNGPGIPSNKQQHLFDRYYRVESNHTQHISGFGIGLYLSAEIVRRHDGNIWVESEIGKGSTFYFSLP